MFVFAVLFGVWFLNMFRFVFGMFGVWCLGTGSLCSVSGSGALFCSVFGHPSSQSLVLMIIYDDHR